MLLVLKADGTFDYYGRLKVGDDDALTRNSRPRETAYRFEGDQRWRELPPAPVALTGLPKLTALGFCKPPYALTPAPPSLVLSPNPVTSPVELARAQSTRTELVSGRGDWTRTSDLLNPIQARYQICATPRRLDWCAESTPARHLHHRFSSRLQSAPTNPQRSLPLDRRPLLTPRPRAARQASHAEASPSIPAATSRSNTSSPRNK